MSNRQERKAQQRMQKVAKTITDGIDLSGLAKKALEESAASLSAVDLIHGIKESWTKAQRQELADWLMDEEAGRWG